MYSCQSQLGIGDLFSPAGGGKVNYDSLGNGSFYTNNYNDFI